MPYTLGQAAKATGITKTTIAEAIKKGRLSASKDDSGRYQIDPAELHRVYPPVSEQGKDDVQSEQYKTLELTAKIMALEAQIKAVSELKDQIASERDDLRADRDHWRKQATALITDQRAKPEPSRTAGFWQRLLGGV